jgi:hypothetical protein
MIYVKSNAWVASTVWFWTSDSKVIYLVGLKVEPYHVLRLSTREEGLWLLPFPAWHQGV